jgi:hypothetical protein
MPGSGWTDKISRQILDYAERGVIELTKTKWWRSKGGTCTGTASTLKENRLSLNMSNVSGLFVVMLTGAILFFLLFTFYFEVSYLPSYLLSSNSVYVHDKTPKSIR